MIINVTCKICGKYIGKAEIEFGHSGSRYNRPSFEMLCVECAEKEMNKLLYIPDLEEEAIARAMDY